MPWGRGILAALVTLLVVGGMSSLALMGTGVVPPDFASTLGRQDAAALSQPFADLRAGNDDALLARLVEGTDPAQARAQIDTMQSLLPPAEPQRSRLTSWRSQVGTTGNRLWGVHEYDFPDHVARAETTLYRATSDAPWAIEGFHINVATRQQLAQNVFDFASAPVAVKAIVVAAIVLPLFLLATFLVVLFEPGLKRRWLWLLWVAFGVGTLYVNTSNGAFSFQPISIQLFGASATWSGSAFDGWVFGASIPLGALWYWGARMFRKAT